MLCIKATVDEYTSPDPITVRPTANVDELQQLLNQHGIRHLPVLSKGKVVGIISDRDIRLVSGLNLAEKLQVTAEDIMTPEPLAVTTDTLLEDVAFLMSEKKVGSVIVNETDGSFLGIFTATDALNALIEILRGVEVLQQETAP